MEIWFLSVVPSYDLATEIPTLYLSFNQSLKGYCRTVRLLVERKTLGQNFHVAISYDRTKVRRKDTSRCLFCQNDERKCNFAIIHKVKISKKNIVRSNDGASESSQMYWAGEEKGRETSFLSEWLNERKCNFAISWVSGKQSRGKFSFPGEWTGSKPQLNFACSDQVEKS